MYPTGTIYVKFMSTGPSVDKKYLSTRQSIRQNVARWVIKKRIKKKESGNNLSQETTCRQRSRLASELIVTRNDRYVLWQMSFYF